VVERWKEVFVASGVVSSNFSIMHATLGVHQTQTLPHVGDSVKKNKSSEHTVHSSLMSRFYDHDTFFNASEFLL
jgi:hypothetical protein